MRYIIFIFLLITLLNIRTYIVCSLQSKHLHYFFLLFKFVLDKTLKSVQPIKDCIVIIDNNINNDPRN